jgi:aerobic C4-dicarboxylate transport protein
MIIAPIIFCTVVHGIASMGDLKRLGRVGLQALIYFEVVSTFALILELIVVNLLQPGTGFTIDVKTLDPKVSQTYAQQAHSSNATDFILNIIPNSFFEGLVRGDILQVLFIAILSGFAISFMGAKGRPILQVVEQASEIFFRIMGMIVKVAPLGAMAFTVGSYGLAALDKLLMLMLCFYLTSIIFVVVVLGPISRLNRFSIFAYLNYRGYVRAGGREIGWPGHLTPPLY